ADQYDVAGRVDFRETSAGWLNCGRSPTNPCHRFQSRTILCVFDRTYERAIKDRHSVLYLFFDLVDFAD
ncbi:MAG: hypothetical protein ACK56W_23295, partial [Pirellula sp.]